MVVVETNLDDFVPEHYERLSELLFELGALDVYSKSIQMKKSRPGLLIGVICDKDLVDTVAECLFTETTAIGVRTTAVERRKLERRWVDWKSPYGLLRYKVAFAGEKVYGIYPEYEVFKKVSIETGVPLKELYGLTPIIE